MNDRQYVFQPTNSIPSTTGVQRFLEENSGDPETEYLVPTIIDIRKSA